MKRPCGREQRTSANGVFVDLAAAPSPGEMVMVRPALMVGLLWSEFAQRRRIVPFAELLMIPYR